MEGAAAAKDDIKNKQADINRINSEIEKHETRQLSTAEAYLEWKLTLAAEPMLKAAKEAGKR